MNCKHAHLKKCNKLVGAINKKSCMDSNVSHTVGALTLGFWVDKAINVDYSFLSEETKTKYQASSLPHESQNSYKCTNY